MSTDTERTIGSVETSFAIVEYIAEHGPSRLSTIANDVDHSKSTVHAHLQTLVNNDYVVQSDKRYALGLGFLRTGARARNRFDVYRAGKQEVDQLADETGEAAHLGVEQHGERVILYKSEIGDAVYDNTPTGEFTDMHWTAVGKAILAHLPQSRARTIVSQSGLPSATDRTITDETRLFDHLERTRERGYAVENEERRDGVVAVGVPIFDTTADVVVAAMSVSGPRQRILDSDGSVEAELLEAVRNRANVTELRFNHY